MDYIIEMLNIRKEFPGIVANDDITLRIKKTEIHALLGENGAGKSTLMSILFGLYKPEAGVIKLRGKEINISDPKTASHLGIGMVHQHFKLVEDFTVLENIILGAETVKNGFLKMDEAKKKVMELSNRYKLYIDPDAKVSNITVGMQQRVEILKMLYRENEILIFDEPTAVLTPQEIDELMDIMKELSKEGKSLIFITHKLEEIKKVADRVTVLRRGKCIGTYNVEDVTKESLSEMMVGRKVQFTVDKKDITPGETIFEVKNLSMKTKGSTKNTLNKISFKVRKNEIVCIAGIDGNGQSELVYALTGIRHFDEGQILVHGEDWTKKSIRYRNSHGMSHIPEDRHKYGLILEYSMAYNLILQTYFTDRFQKRGFLKNDSIHEYADGLIKKYDIRSGQGAQTVTRSMSGGNQQKVILAREIDKDPSIMIAVQPARGLDVGATEFIHKKLVEQRESGKAVLLISLELEEIMNLSDRILVIYEGELVGDLDPKKTTIQELGLYMAGAKRDEVKA
ncbi:MAG TPA: ABC transporter ATP-binding protein [Clostridia bacterium]|jgi:simple sugar transport system ATP-binding protein|nr:ABC transporter ATP-binding protein [Clostridiaceae bacterium]HOF27241.1 ABC transporter ATP-binding protein [Clostridia bacterium]HOM35158.1 ABC transporter ATP-binding protein [Clostridia bacterium]HOR90240.1 ABC transporter ATP-binding protein [Clostridia bacterium]HOT71069.1 ABC transporter ATP-binding protein [Clostridia bacterium]